MDAAQDDDPLKIKTEVEECEEIKNKEEHEELEIKLELVNKDCDPNNFSKHKNESKTTDSHDNNVITTSEVFIPVKNEDIKVEVEKQRTYMCEECDYFTKERRSLWRHKKVNHEGVKYLCSSCNYKATRKSHLNLHITSVHLGMKLLCSQCDYQATQSSHLKRHEVSRHSESLDCNLCDYKATRRSHLNTHISSVHLGSKLLCYHCNFKTPQLCHLKRHMNKKHKHLIKEES